ncbi:MAG: hypothetical protein LBP79_01290 [Clostridiales bacterium]|jgi:hypothetical protein|nr:hypothetical protein [Clostridiales bacterium]
MFKIDGNEYDVIIPQGGIERSFSVYDTKNTERLDNGEMFRDVLGTYYNYSVSVDGKNLSPEQYDALYELLSAPTDFHTFEMPYGQTVLIFQGYVTSGKDTYTGRVGGQNRWSGLSFNMIAKELARLPE